MVLDLRETKRRKVFRARNWMDVECWKWQSEKITCIPSNNQYIKSMNTNLINELIKTIWPHLDAGMSKGEIENALIEVIDSWENAGGVSGSDK